MLLILGSAGAYWLSLSGQGEKIVKVSGVVIDPLTRTPVGGVDLVVGDTSIRTGESGHFVFTDVSTQTGIRLTHPELLRAILRLPETKKAEQDLDFLFNVDLYNTLVQIIDSEARGKIDLVYNHLASEIREKVSGEVFRMEYEAIFGGGDITNQEIVIRDMRKVEDFYNRKLDLRFSGVIEFEVINGSKSKWIRLVEVKEKGNSEWKLIY